MKSPRRWVGSLPAVAALVTVLGHPVAAVGQDPPRNLIQDPLHIMLQVNTSFHDNFFQAPSGQPDTTVRAGGIRARFSERWLRALGGEAYLDGRVTVYDEFEPTYGVGGGVRLNRWRQRLDLGVDHDWWLPRLDGPDAIGRADVSVVRGDYWLRMGRPLELSATARHRWERVGSGMGEPVRDGAEANGPVEWSDQTFSEVGGAVRTRIFGRAFSPEVGFARGGPRGLGPDQEYDQRQRHVQVRSMPHDRLYLAVRYRERDRSYPRAHPDASNFQREDQREQLTVLAEIRWTEMASWVVYYAREDGVSSRMGRDFTTRLLSIGLTLRNR